MRGQSNLLSYLVAIKIDKVFSAWKRHRVSIVRAGIDEAESMGIAAPVHLLLFRHLTKRAAYLGIILLVSQIDSVLLFACNRYISRMFFTHQVRCQCPLNLVSANC